MINHRFLVAKFHGKRTANGEIFDMDLVSAALDIAYAKYGRVTNLRNGKALNIRLNDRAVRGRISDLSRQQLNCLILK